MVRLSTLPSATCMRPRPMSLTVIIFRPRVVTNFRSISKSRRVRPSPQSHSATHSFGFPSTPLRSGLWIKWQLYQYLYMVRERIMNSSKNKGKRRTELFRIVCSIRRRFEIIVLSELTKPKAVFQHFPNDKARKQNRSFDEKFSMF